MSDFFAVLITVGVFHTLFHAMVTDGKDFHRSFALMFFWPLAWAMVVAIGLKRLICSFFDEMVNE
jgi:hypothetical protein